MCIRDRSCQVLETFPSSASPPSPPRRGLLSSSSAPLSRWGSSDGYSGPRAGAGHGHVRGQGLAFLYLSVKKRPPRRRPVFAGCIASENLKCSPLIFAGASTPLQKPHWCEILNSLTSHELQPHSRSIPSA